VARVGGAAPLGACLELAAAMVLVGSSVVVGKLLVVRWPVFLVAGLRLVLAAAVLVILLLAVERGLPAIGPRDLALLALQAFAGFFLFNTLLLHGLRLTSAAEGGIVTSTTPAVAALLSVLLLGERLGVRAATGIALTVAGLLAMHLMSVSGPTGGSDSLQGNLMILGAVIAEGLYVVCGKAVAPRLSPLTIATGLCVLGSLMFLPLALWQARAVSLGDFGVGEWGAVAYYALAVTVLALLLWSRGLLHVPASTAAAFTGLLPVSAVGLAYLVLRERFQWAHAVGGACVVGGILLVTRPR